MGAMARAFFLLVISVTASRAEAARPQDTAAVTACLASDRGQELSGERCIGVVADPCLEMGLSTADQAECATREFLVWDAMLNAGYNTLLGKLDRDQTAKLREAQRAWITARDRSCEFYWHYHQGTIAVPMAAYCKLRETARRVMYLKAFIE